MSESLLKVRRFFWICNIFAVSQNGNLTIIDTGAWNTARNLRRIFKWLRADLNDVRRIVITHSHFDHAGSLALLRHLTKAKVFAHEEEVPYVTHEKRIPTPHGPGAPLFELGEPVFRAPRAKVDAALKDGDIIEDTGIRVIHTPGHTPGHISLYHEESKALFTGDILVNHLGRVTGPVPFFSSDIEQARKSLEKLIPLDVKTIYFAHGLPKRHAPEGLIESIYSSLK